MKLFMRSRKPVNYIAPRYAIVLDNGHKIGTADDLSIANKTAVWAHNLYGKSTLVDTVENKVVFEFKN